ncbi:MAG: LysR family transcriptional regulator [Phyllobacterium sp.]
MASPSIDFGSLRIFEAVGRLENLTRAAEELGMTQPAVSYQINRMEDRLGAALFIRKSRGMQLLPEGKILHDAVRSGIAAIDEAVRHIERKRQSPSLRIVTDYGFATFWLMPRVAAFRQKHPEIDVRITASPMLHSVDTLDTDISIQFGAKEDFTEDATLFFGEEVVPVCSPGYLKRFGPFPGGEGLGSVSLLHLDTLQGHRWFTWPSWLAHLGHDMDEGNHGLVLNTYNLVIEAAIAEQGVALGWMGLIDSALEKRQLVRACDTSLKSEKGYWLTYSADASLQTRQLVTELIGKADAD